MLCECCQAAIYSDSIESCGQVHGAAPQTAECAQQEAAEDQGQVTLGSCATRAEAQFHVCCIWREFVGGTGWFTQCIRLLHSKPAPFACLQAGPWQLA